MQALNCTEQVNYEKQDCAVTDNVDVPDNMLADGVRFHANSVQGVDANC